MRHEVMMEMSNEQLDQYAQACGIDTSGESTKVQKVALIEERRGRVAEANLLGMTVAIPVKRLHDKRIADLIEGKRLTDDEAFQAFRELLGEEQHAAIMDRCTDEDGTIDGEAYAIAMASLLTNGELKNY